MDQPMMQNAEGSKTEEKLICRIRRNGGLEGEIPFQDGQFKSLKMRMGEGKEHELIVQHGVGH